jgi:hypothetical protein
MLAQVFNPTEIKKNGPATRPAIAPARRVAFLLRARGVVLPDTRPKLLRRVCTVNRCWSSAGEGVNCRYSRVIAILRVRDASDLLRGAHLISP